MFKLLSSTLDPLQPPLVMFFFWKLPLKDPAFPLSASLARSLVSIFTSSICKLYRILHLLACERSLPLQKVWEPSPSYTWWSNYMLSFIGGFLLLAKTCQKVKSKNKTWKMKRFWRVSRSQKKYIKMWQTPIFGFVAINTKRLIISFYLISTL